jgi:hypothetical protein
MIHEYLVVALAGQALPLRETCRYFSEVIGTRGIYLAAESLQEVMESALAKIKGSGNIEIDINLNEADKIVATASRGFFWKRLTGFAYVCRPATKRAGESLLKKISGARPPKEADRYVSAFICMK